MTQIPVHQIFVYGSLRSGFESPAFEYISRYFRLVSASKVRGLLYDMGEYPAALPCAEDNFLVGELYAIKDPEEFFWAIEQLDDYEGLNAEPEEDCQSFRRELVEVITPNGVEMAWVYWFNGSIENKPIIASGNVLEYLHQQQKKG
jgi:gamma-glutamylcyclotransferase (GGCT)/AIG2-like uncharacterized protein YtfP